MQEKLTPDDTVLVNREATTAAAIRGLYPCNSARRLGDQLILPVNAKMPEICINSGKADNLKSINILVSRKTTNPLLVFFCLLTPPIGWFCLFTLSSRDLVKRKRSGQVRSVKLNCFRRKRNIALESPVLILLVVLGCAMPMFTIFHPILDMPTITLTLSFAAALILIPVRGILVLPVRLYLEYHNDYAIVFRGAPAVFLDRLDELPELERQQLFDITELEW